MVNVMAQIILKTRGGSKHEFDGQHGMSLMENIRNAGFDELLAMCGGCLSCATCHVYVESLPPGAQLPEPSRDETDLMDGSDHRQDNSRLSCQIAFGPDLDGIVIAIAPEE